MEGPVTLTRVTTLLPQRSKKRYLNIHRGKLEIYDNFNPGEAPDKRNEKGRKEKNLIELLSVEPNHEKRNTFEVEFAQKKYRVEASDEDEASLWVDWLLPFVGQNDVDNVELPLSVNRALRPCIKRIAEQNVLRSWLDPSVEIAKDLKQTAELASSMRNVMITGALPNSTSAANAFNIVRKIIDSLPGPLFGKKGNELMKDFVKYPSPNQTAFMDVHDDPRFTPEKRECVQNLLRLLEEFLQKSDDDEGQRSMVKTQFIRVFGRVFVGVEDTEEFPKMNQALDIMLDCQHMLCSPVEPIGDEEKSLEEDVTKFNLNRSRFVSSMVDKVVHAKTRDQAREVLSKCAPLHEYEKLCNDWAQLHEYCKKVKADCTNAALEASSLRVTLEEERIQHQDAKNELQEKIQHLTASLAKIDSELLGTRAEALMLGEKLNEMPPSAHHLSQREFSKAFSALCHAAWISTRDKHSSLEPMDPFFQRLFAISSPPQLILQAFPLTWNAYKGITLSSLKALVSIPISLLTTAPQTMPSEQSREESSQAAQEA